jgi:hypothetical protein
MTQPQPIPLNRRPLHYKIDPSKPILINLGIVVAEEIERMLTLMKIHPVTSTKDKPKA